MTNNIDIKQLENEELNTANNFYICHVYEAKNYFFKFYISFPESFQLDGDISEKEKSKITEIISKKEIKEKTYFFIYRYSDFVPVNPEGL